MLERFTARDFKSLIEVTVDLGVVNVFIGANGSGKSNLLEALGILGAAASGRVNDESLKYRGVRPGVPALYKASFRNRQGAQHIRFEGEGDGAAYSVSLWNPIEKPLAEWQYKHESLVSNGKPIVGRSPKSAERLNKGAGLAALRLVELPEDDPAGMLLELLQNYAIYAPNTPTLRGLEPDPQSREPLGLAGGRLPESVGELVRSPLDLHLEDLLPLVDWMEEFWARMTNSAPFSSNIPQVQHSLRFVDRFMNVGRNMLSCYDGSEGILYLLFCSVLALHPKTPKLFAIDNFDQALNPRTARDFTRAFCRWLLVSQDRQVLLTTHNPLVLDGLPLSDDRIRLFAVDRTKRGHTVVSRVEVNDNLLKSAEKGIPLSQQWVMGHFGGVPSSI